MTSEVRAAAVRCGAAAVLFGATTPVASRLAADTPAPMLAGLLYIGAALAVTPAVVHDGTTWAAVERAWRPLAGAVVFGGLLGPLLLVVGLARTSAATASLLLNLELVATAVLAAVVFREHIGRRAGAGIGLVVASGCLLGWSGAPDARLGALLVVGACVCWGIDNCVTANVDQVSPATITLVKGVVAGTTNVALGLVVGGALPTVGVTAAAAAVGMVGYGASITLWVTGARVLGAARGQLLFSTAPFVGVAVAWGALGDAVRPVERVAVVVAATGVACVVGSDHEHLHSHQPVAHEHPHRHDDGHHDHPHEGIDPSRPHTHPHEHRPLVHAHAHLPDLHHRHDH